MDQFGYVIFKRNTRKKNADYAQEVLEEVLHPMTIQQLKNVINTRHPNAVASDVSLRSILNKNKDRFIYFSRTSTYGLIDWENEMENIMGGTISDIVERYLHDFQTPKHIGAILENVLRYRPDTNTSSLRAILLLERYHRFKFYGGQYIGLQANSERDREFKVKKLIGSHFRLKVFDLMRGWSFERITQYFVDKYGYDPTMVEATLIKKVEAELLSFSEDNTLM